MSAFALVTSFGKAQPQDAGQATDLFMDRAKERLVHHPTGHCEILRHPGLAAVSFDSATGTRGGVYHKPDDPAINGSIFFDGRLDNRRELISKLAGSTRWTDAHLAFELFTKYGDSFLKSLEGPFALVVIEPGERSVLLARSVTGARPLYYHRKQEVLVVGSEAVAVLAYPGVSSELNPEMLAAFFSVLRPPASGLTFFRQVQEVTPGIAVRMTQEGVQSHCFRQIIGGQLRFATDADAVEQFRDVLQQAVSCRLPEGESAAILMSGGLDSTTVAALAASDKGREHLKLHATSWVFDELKASNEREFIEPVVNRFDLDWLPIDGDQLWPLGDFSNWPHDPNTPFEGPYRRLAAASYDAVAATGCRVMLNGEYGDQLFAGWSWWLRDLLTDARLLAAGKEMVNEFRANGTGGLRSPLVQLLLGRKRHSRLPDPSVPWLNDHALNLLSDYPQIPSSVSRPEQWRILCDPVNELTPTLEIRHAARHGIENRRPFRDLRLIEMALQMPSHLFYRPGWKKWILREATRGLLPEQTRSRRWGSTLSPLFVRGLFGREQDLIEDLLWSNDRHWPAFVREDWMRENVARLKAGAADGVAWVVLWRVLCYEIWRRRESWEDPQT